MNAELKKEYSMLLPPTAIDCHCGWACERLFGMITADDPRYRATKIHTNEVEFRDLETVSDIDFGPDAVRVREGLYHTTDDFSAYYCDHGEDPARILPVLFEELERIRSERAASQASRDADSPST